VFCHSVGWLTSITVLLFPVFKLLLENKVKFSIAAITVLQTGQTGSPSKQTGRTHRRRSHSRSRRSRSRSRRIRSRSRSRSHARSRSSSHVHGAGNTII